MDEVKIPDDLKPTRLEGQALASLLAHAKLCDEDIEYDWDKQDKKRRHAMNAALDLKAAYERIAHLTAENAALRALLAEARKASKWQEITPDNMPGFDDEIGRYHPHYAGYWFETSSDFVSHKFEDYVAFGWTHFRPINPPEPSNPTRHGYCPACANGQCLERGEGTHREATIEHPLPEDEANQ